MLARRTVIWTWAAALVVASMGCGGGEDLEVQRNVITGETRKCYSVSVNAGASFGGGVTMLGFSYSTETPLWGRTRQPVRRGDGC